MPVREIKTTLSLDGEKEFKKELESAGREMRVLQSELKAIASEFEATGDEQQYLTEKSRTLNAQVRQQENIVEALGRALEDAQKKYGDTAKATDGYRIKLKNAEARMFDLRRASEAANRELEEFGRDSVRIGQQIESGIGDAAEEARHDLKDMFADVAGNLDELRASVGVQTAIDVGHFVVDTVNAVSDFVADKNELNRKKSQLIHNAEGYGISADEIMELVSTIAGATGEMDSAMEAASNLAAVGFEDQEQRMATLRALLGVYMASGGTLDISSLAESFLESISEGKPMGSFEEALVKFAGMNSEQVEGAMSSAQTINEKIELATAYLTEAGMQTKWTTYENSYQDLIDYQQKQVDLAFAWSELAEELTPFVTGLTDAGISVVETLTEWVAVAKEKVSTLIDMLEAETLKLGTGAAETVETAKGAVEQKAEQEKIKDAGGELAGLIYEGAAEKLSAELGSLADVVSRGYASNMSIIGKYDLTAPGVAEIVDELSAFMGMIERDEGPSKIEGLSFKQIIEKVGQYIGDVKNGERKIEEDILSGIGAIYEMFGADFGVTLKDQTGEDGKEAGAALVDGMAENEENAKVAGQNFMIAVENGITERAPYLYDKIQSILNNAASILNQPVGVPGNSVYSGSGGGNSNITAADRGGMAILQIDGQTAGRLLYSGVSREGARRTRTAMTIG